MTSVGDLLGNELVDNKKNAVQMSTVVADSKVIGLYFSAHWCPPCRGFTPSLAQFYNHLKGTDKKFEVVFVSSDRNESEWAEYFEEMPWLALPYNDREKKNQLAEAFNVTGIPTLILLDAETGDVINDNARMNVVQDPTGAKFPWKE